MSRLQLALNVSDLEEAITFYSRLFDAAPHKRRPGYANFALEQPPLKLVLFEGEGAGGSINHLGVEVDSTDQVHRATARLRDTGMSTDVRLDEVCCHARQDKVWVDGPDGARWEIYTVTDDAPEPLPQATTCCSAPTTGRT